MTEITTRILEKGEGLIEIKGALSTNETAELLKRYGLNLIDSGCRWLLFDFKEVTFIDSVCLGALISLLRHARNNGGGIVLFQLDTNVREIFSVTGLDNVFTIAKSLGAARLAVQESS